MRIRAVLPVVVLLGSLLVGGSAYAVVTPSCIDIDPSPAVDLVVTFSDSGSSPVDNFLEIGFGVAPPNNLTFSLNGGAASSALGCPVTGTAAFADIGELRVLLEDGTDALGFDGEAFTFSYDVQPGGSDLGRNPAAFGIGLSAASSFIDVEAKGVDVLQIDGDENDDLELEFDGGDVAARLSAAPNGFDVVRSDVLPPVYFTDLNRFRLTGNENTAVEARLALRNLAQAAIYETNLGGADHLIVEGSPTSDTVSVDLPTSAVPSTRITLGTVVVTNIVNNLEHVDVETRGGADRVVVNVANFAGPRVLVDGGRPTSPSGDVLRVTSVSGNATFTKQAFDRNTGTVVVRYPGRKVKVDYEATEKVRF